MILLETLGNPVLNIIIFALFVVATLTVVIRVTANQSKAAGSFYTGGASFSGTQNGLAISGDYLSAAAFLGVTGAIALSGYDGFLYSVAFLIALVLCAVGWIAFSRASPDSLIDPPAEAKTPARMPR